MIKATIVGDDRVKAFLGTRFPAAQKAIYRTMTRLVLKLSRKIKEEKLTGQVLKNQSGRLRRSINPDVFESGTNIVGQVATNVEYASAHEYGFKGPVTIKEHLRMQVKAFGKAMKNPRKVVVKQHTANMNFPERSFMRTALEEMRPEIRAAFEGALAEVIKT